MAKHHHDEGLAYDLPRMVAVAGRRQALRWAAVAGLVPAIGCGGVNDLRDTMSGSGDGTGGSGGAGGGGTGGSGGGADGAGGGGATSCARVPEETAGPYPADGSNGPNALALAGIVRGDMRSSFDGASGTAEGVPMTMTLTVVDGGCAPLAGRAVYLWHCDRDGKYSMYDVADQNYLRAVQATGADGAVTFITIFPACYAGRMPHMHFEIYPDLAAAAAASGRLVTSQIAFPIEVCNAVYAAEGYEQSAANLAGRSFASDLVFGDGTALQMATVAGSVGGGYAGSLTVAVGA
jgi:protocatechuate 3,4-dioxygenase beta subunit